MMLFGNRCEHMANVTTIYFLIRDKMAIFERMEKKHVAHLLWSIFVDARAYFNTPFDEMGNPPVSSLDWLIGGMRSGAMPSTLGTPLQSLLGGSEGGPGGSGGNRPERDPNGPRYQQGPQGPNPNVHAKIEAATAAARRKNSNLDYRLVMASAPLPKPRITSMQLSRGGCFDYLFFGTCGAGTRCSFKHDGEVDESKIDGAIEKMRPGLAKFVELN
jgi:hypothetical protein